MISVVLATYNEEKTLARCLESVQSFADEIIIADGHSQDTTVAIGKQFGAKIIPTTNKPNFHINKQMAMDAAKGELVLQMDSDEVVDDELKNFILITHKNVLKRSPQDNKTQPVAWWIRRKNLFLGHFFKKAGQYPDPVIRLYVNGYAQLPQKDVHEQMKVKGQVGWAAGHLIHYANPTFADYLRKWQAYTSLKATQLKAAHVQITVSNTVRYCIWLPTKTFFLIFVRHKGFMDGVAGLVFSIMSGLYFPMAYSKLWELYQHHQSPYARTD